MSSSGQTEAVPAHEDGSVWTPLAHPGFRWLWIGVVISTTGTWMQAVGAQWLYVDASNAGAIVSLIQAATTGPMLVLALPAGVLADSFDRRHLLIGVQAYAVVLGLVLAALTAADQMSAALLIVFTAALGSAAAVMMPTWMATISDLVPRSAVPAAARLDQVSVNVGRSVGPAIAGAVIAVWGVATVFALNAATSAILVVILLWRRSGEEARVGQREQFVPALRAGGRYVRHDPAVRRVLGRMAALVAPATAVWALLPLIADQQLGVGPGAYGIMYAALGVGAMAGALTGGRLRRWLSGNMLVVAATAAAAIGLAVVSTVSSSIWVLPPLVVVGFGWTTSVAALIGQLQLILPDWVRARGLAVGVMVFTGTQTAASPMWGLAADRFGVSNTVLVASVLVAVSAAGGLSWRLPDAKSTDPTPLAYWVPVSFAVVPAPDDGPVVVEVSYVIEHIDQSGFLDAMQDMRRSRLRSGATRWDLFRTGEEPTHFVELFSVPSWSEHQRQHDGRLTAEDQAIEEAAFSFCAEPPRHRHLLPPTTNTQLDPE